LEIIKQIHIDCFRLCKESMGWYLPIAGNIGVFCQSQDDYEKLSRLSERITEPSSDPNQKYFRLKEPITIPPIESIPQTSYTYLYIRKPSPDTPQQGDVDFVLPYDKFQELQSKLLSGERIPNARIYTRPGWDMVELISPKINSLAYISYQQMAEKARIRFDQDRSLVV